MAVNGYTRVCGVMGSPVEHTLSPVIHNTLAESLGENLIRFMSDRVRWERRSGARGR